jgi:hypothetical protein
MTAEEEAKAKKQALLAAWKRDREAKKALDGAKAKAMALAGKAGPQGKQLLSSCVDKISHPLDLCFLYSPFGIFTTKTTIGHQSYSSHFARTERFTSQT